MPCRLQENSQIVAGNVRPPAGDLPKVRDVRQILNRHDRIRVGQQALPNPLGALLQLLVRGTGTRHQFDSAHELAGYDRFGFVDERSLVLVEVHTEARGAVPGIMIQRLYGISLCQTPVRPQLAGLVGRYVHTACVGAGVVAAAGFV